MLIINYKNDIYFYIFIFLFEIYSNCEGGIESDD